MIHLHITVESVGCNGDEARRFLGGIGVERFNAWVRTGKIKKAARDWYLYEDLVAFANSMRGATSTPDLEVVDITDALPNPKPVKRAKKGQGGLYLTPAD